MFISHDLAVVEHVADDVIVMYRGRVVEKGPASELFGAPAHPCTQFVGAESAMSGTNGRQPFQKPTQASNATGSVISGGCAYAGTCLYVESACRERPVELAPLPGSPARAVACIKPLV